MAKKKSNATVLDKKRRESVEKKQKVSNIIAYITAGVAVVAIIAITTIAYN